MFQSYCQNEIFVLWNKTLVPW